MTRGEADVFEKKWQSLHGRDTRFIADGAPRTQAQLAYREYFLFIDRVLWRSGLDYAKARLLEVGCGRGTISLYLTRDRQAWCAGLDVSEQALRLARGNFERDAQVPRLVCGDVLQLPFHDGTLDAVVAIGLLEHFQEIVAPLAEMRRVIKSGGLVLSLNIPRIQGNVSALAWPYNFVAAQLLRAVRFRPRKVVRLLRDGLPKGLYRNSYPPARYRDAARACGLREVELVGINPFPHLAPAPPVLEEIIVRVYCRVLAFRKRLGMADPFVSSLKWAHAHFLLARK